MKHIQGYQAEDGRIFETEKLCLEYEEECKVINFAQNFRHFMMNLNHKINVLNVDTILSREKLDDRGYIPYIENFVKNEENIRRNIDEAFILAKKSLDENFLQNALDHDVRNSQEIMFNKTKSKRCMG